MRRILYNEDGTVSVIHPAPKSKRSGETEQQWLKRVFDKATPSGINYEDVPKENIPIDRTFRQAWTGEKGKGIIINEVKKQQLIAERKQT